MSTGRPKQEERGYRREKKSRRYFSICGNDHLTHCWTKESSTSALTNPPTSLALVPLQQWWNFVWGVWGEKQDCSSLQYFYPQEYLIRIVNFHGSNGLVAMVLKNTILFQREKVQLIFFWNAEKDLIWCCLLENSHRSELLDTHWFQCVSVTQGRIGPANDLPPMEVGLAVAQRVQRCA